MFWFQRQLDITPRGPGFHLVTHDVTQALPEISKIRVGMLHVFNQHTSASLTLNENADPDVRQDLDKVFNGIAPDDFPYTHTAEGPDDMPSHVKSSILGSSLLIPIGDGRLQLGTWQGIYFCEHRIEKHRRRLVLTLWGEST